VDELHHAGDDRGVGIGQYAVAEVEDVACRGAALAHDPAYLTLDDRPLGEQQGGIEIALHDRSSADPTGRLVQWDAPVGTDHVGTGRPDEVEKLPGAAAVTMIPRRSIDNELRAEAAARDSAPAHESNSCTAPAPAAIWTLKNSRAMTASRLSSAWKSIGWPCIMALVRPWSREGPPSIR